ncbi:MAG: EamA family transporter [Desulfobulbus sp.]
MLLDFQSAILNPPTYSRWLFSFWNRAVRIVGANKAGPFVHLMPVFSSILAVFFLDEIPAWYQGKGLLLIFAGIVLATVGIGQKRLD